MSLTRAPGLTRIASPSPFGVLARGSAGAPRVTTRGDFLCPGHARSESLFWLMATTSTTRCETRASGSGWLVRALDGLMCARSVSRTCQPSTRARWHVCPTCETRFMRHEEKETDVAMGSKLLELFSRDECDGAVLLSGDSDIAPAVRAATRLFPTKRVYSCFPYRRRSALLGTIVRKAFRVSLQRYGRFQLPDPVVLTSGLRIRRPAGRKKKLAMIWTVRGGR